MNGPSTLIPRNPEVSSEAGTRNISSALLRAVLGIAFASALALSPVPAFAQHGGGGGHAGGGGGGHFGGGGGGGRASGGGGSRGTSTGTATGSRGGSSTGSGTGSGAGSGTGSASTGSTSAGARGSAGNFSTGPGTFVSGGVARGSNASRVSAARYAGGNNTWQAPPNAAGARIQGTPARTFLSSSDAVASGARVVHAPVEPRGMRGPLGASTAMRGTYAGSASGLPPHIGPFRPRGFQPIFFFGGGCFGGFSPGFCGGGFFGGGFWGYGYGWGCDPFWGCPGWFGNGYGGGYGSVYNGGYSNGGSYGNVIYGASTDDSSVSNEFNPSRYSSSFEGSGSESIASEGAGAAENGGDYAAIAPEMALYLKDGTVYALSDYWVADGKLHYVTNYGGENAIDLEQIDMQRTVDVNAKRGISVTLKPAPVAAPTAPQAPQE